jgi:hypothetical protein
MRPIEGVASRSSLAIALVVGVLGCRPLHDCRPGTAHVVVACDDTRAVISTRVHVQDDSLPGGKDVEVPLTCPGQSSLDLAITDYHVGRELAVTVTPITASGPLPPQAPFKLSLTSECTSTVIHLTETDDRIPGGGGGGRGGRAGLGGATETGGAGGTPRTGNAEGSTGAAGVAGTQGLTTGERGGNGGTALSADAGASNDDAGSKVDSVLPDDGGVRLDASRTEDAHDTSTDLALDGVQKDGGLDATDLHSDPVVPGDAAVMPFDAITMDVPTVDSNDVDSGQPADLGGHLDVGPDVPPHSTQCDPSKPFGPPTLVPGLAAGEVGDVRLSADELTAYFGILNNGQSDLYMATRSSTDAAFANMSLLQDLSGPTNDLALTFTADALTAYLESNRGGAYRIYVASRTATTLPFGTPSIVFLGQSIGDGASFVTLKGNALYFDSPGAARARLVRLTCIEWTSLAAPSASRWHWTV